MLWSPSLKALGRKLAEFQPTLLYALSPGSRRPQQQEEEEWEPEGAGEGDTQETLGKFSIRCSDDPESAGVSLESEELVALLMEAGVQVGRRALSRGGGGSEADGELHRDRGGVNKGRRS